MKTLVDRAPGRSWAMALAVSATFLLAGCGDDAAAPTSTSGQASLTAPPASSEPDGEGIYNKFCFSCHAAGVAGAPRLGDVEAWAPRLAQGRDLLLQHTIEGMPPGMPAKGLCNQCSDAELAASLDYMLATLEPADGE